MNFSQLLIPNCKKGVSKNVANKRKYKKRTPVLSVPEVMMIIVMYLMALIRDKGYISKDLFDKLFIDGIQLITKLHKCRI